MLWPFIALERKNKIFIYDRRKFIGLANNQTLVTWGIFSDHAFSGPWSFARRDAILHHLSKRASTLSVIRESGFEPTIEADYFSSIFKEFSRLSRWSSSAMTAGSCFFLCFVIVFVVIEPILSKATWQTMKGIALFFGWIIKDQGILLERILYSQTEIKHINPSLFPSKSGLLWTTTLTSTGLNGLNLILTTRCQINIDHYLPVHDNQPRQLMQERGLPTYSQ